MNDARLPFVSFPFLPFPFLPFIPEPHPKNIKTFGSPKRLIQMQPKEVSRPKGKTVWQLVARPIDSKDSTTAPTTATASVAATGDERVPPSSAPVVSREKREGTRGRGGRGRGAEGRGGRGTEASSGKLATGQPDQSKPNLKHPRLNPR